MNKSVAKQNQLVKHNDSKPAGRLRGRIGQTYSPHDGARWPDIPPHDARTSSPDRSSMHLASISAPPHAPEAATPLRVVHPSKTEQPFEHAPIAPSRSAGSTFHHAPLKLVTAAQTEVTAMFGGDVHHFPVAPGQTLLEAADEAGLDLPRSCAVKCSGACKCTLAGGSVEIPDDACLTDDERGARQVLTCVGLPTSAWVILEFD